MRASVVWVALALAAASLAQAAQDRAYHQSIEVVWEEAYRAVRDVDFVVVEADRDDHEMTIRTQRKAMPSRGLRMLVSLTASGDVTTVRVRAQDPSKANKAAEPIIRYLDAVDARMEDYERGP